jgi:hypothetical protein
MGCTERYDWRHQIIIHENWKNKLLRFRFVMFHGYRIADNIFTDQLVNADADTGKRVLRDFETHPVADSGLKVQGGVC